MPIALAAEIVPPLVIRVVVIGAHVFVYFLTMQPTPEQSPIPAMK